MEYEALKWIALSLLSVVVYFLKRTVDQIETSALAQSLVIKQLEGEIQTIKTDYLHKNEFKEFKQELREMFLDIREDIKGLRKN